MEPASELFKRIRVERRKRWEEAELEKLKGKGLKGEKLNTEFAKQRKKYKEPALVDTTDLPELPEGWCWATIAEIAESALGKMLDRQKHKSGLALPYLRNVNVRWGYIDTSDLFKMNFKDTEIDRYSIIYGDVIVCEGGEPGRAAVWENNEVILYQKALHRIRPLMGINPWLIVYHLWHDAQLGILESYFTGTTIKHFTGISLQKYFISIPPVEEQKEIIDHLKSAFFQIEKLYDVEGKILKQLSTFDNSILFKAFSGSIAPQNQNDEPASVILERICKEKVSQTVEQKFKPRKMTPC